MNTAFSSGDDWAACGNISADSNTRQLFITLFADTNLTQSTSQNPLLYKDSGGNVAALLQVPEPEPGHGLYWLDISSSVNSIPRSDFSPVYFHTDSGLVASSTLREVLPGGKLRAPFTSRSSISPNPSGPEVDLFVCDGGTDGNLT